MSEILNHARRWFKSATFRVGLMGPSIHQVLPGRVRSVLFICKGNICRSPFAASYLKANFKRRNCPIEVYSAGLETALGKEANPLARHAALRHDVSLEAHATTPVNDDLIRRADLIIAMESAQCKELVKIHPDSARKVFRLGDFSRGLAKEIWDPYGGTTADFDFCFRTIRRCCDNLSVYLTER